MHTEPVETNGASDPSVSAQILAFALLVVGEPHSARPFPNMPAALARWMLSARSDFLNSSLACDACPWKGRCGAERVKPKKQIPKLITLIRDHMRYLALMSTEQERQAAYRELFRYQLDLGLIDEMRDATLKRLVLGSDRFKAEIEAMLKRKVEPAKRGRSIKNRDDQSEGEQTPLLAENK